MIRRLVTILNGLVFLSFCLTSCPLHAADLTFVDEYLSPELSKKVSMDFQNAQLNNVLKILSQQSGMNFVASDTIANKEINLYLDNVPVWEALERILEANSLTYEVRPGSNIFMVKELKKATKDLISRIYQLNHATVPSHLLNSTLTFDESLGSDSSSSSSDSSSTSEDAEGIVAAVKMVLSEDGSVVEDRRTNSLIVTDYPSQFSLIEQTIARLDVRIPQILIEAEMLDITKNTADLLGAKFSGEFFKLTQGSSKQVIFPFDDKDNSLPGGLNTYPDLSLASFKGFNVLIQFLRTQTDTKNLARPRILTLNNQTATIAIKTDEAVGIEQNSSGIGGSESQTIEAERTETGVFLKVTPYANIYSREITMAVEPKVIQARTGATFSGQSFKDPEERGSKSILRIMDGDTIIIGGLLRTDITDIRTSVPVISKIPIVGAAFRHKDKKEDQRELIVFLTPHIVKEHLVSNDRDKERSFAREQDAPSGSRWQTINDNLSLMGR
ncbi:MAG TPA: secretin N-terminal domain-containing protein [Candidatus Omnitrophota bacterium]|nr:secretin N-terminal domain-containing protein [Candidatus Omnitrophota bacterium]